MWRDTEQNEENTCKSFYGQNRLWNRPFAFLSRSPASSSSQPPTLTRLLQGTRSREETREMYIESEQEKCKVISKLRAFLPSTYSLSMERWSGRFHEAWKAQGRENGEKISSLFGQFQSGFIPHSVRKFSCRSRVFSSSGNGYERVNLNWRIL